MQKTKIGISVGVMGAVMYFASLFGGLYTNAFTGRLHFFEGGKYMAEKGRFQGCGADAGIFRLRSGYKLS